MTSSTTESSVSLGEVIIALSLSACGTAHRKPPCRKIARERKVVERGLTGRGWVGYTFLAGHVVLAGPESCLP